MRLRDHPGGMYEESLHNLQCALEDHWWARYFVRRLGKEERGRFSEEGWAYGDPSLFYGGDVMDVFAYQARVVAKSLFTQRVSCNLLGYSLEDEELYDLQAALVDESGLSAFGTVEEQFAIYGEALHGDLFTLVAEFTGDAESMWRIKGALRAVNPHLLVLFYDPDSGRGRDLDPSEHFVLLLEGELCPERELVHYNLFEMLLKTWEAMRTTKEVT